MIGMNEMMELNTPLEIDLAITALLEKYAFGPTDNFRIVQLRKLFKRENTPSLNYQLVAQTLFPPTSHSRAAGVQSRLNLVKFLSRFKRSLETAVEKGKLFPQETIDLVTFGSRDEKIIKVFVSVSIELILTGAMLESIKMWCPEHSKKPRKDKTSCPITDNFNQWLQASTSPILVFLTDKKIQKIQALQKYCQTMLLDPNHYTTVPLWLNIALCDMNPCKSLPYIDQILLEIIVRQFDLTIDFEMLRKSIAKGNILPIFDFRGIDESDYTFARFGILMSELRKLVEKGENDYKNKIILIMPKSLKFTQPPGEIDTMVLGPKYTGFRYPVYNKEELSIIE